MSDGRPAEAPDLVHVDKVSRAPWVVLGVTYGMAVLLTASGVAWLFAWSWITYKLNTGTATSGDLQVEAGIGLIAVGLIFGAASEITRRQRSAAWRERIIDESNFLALQLSRVPAANRGGSDYQMASRGIQAAREAINRGWYSESASAPRAWSSLHSASESLVLIGDDNMVRDEAIEIDARLAASPLSASDPRQARYRETLAAVLAETKRSHQISVSMRDGLAEILHTLNDRTERVLGDLRSYMGIVATAAAGLGLTLALVVVISAADPLIFPICANPPVTPLCPGGALKLIPGVSKDDFPSSLDVVYIVLLGSFGGWFFALRGLLPLQNVELNSRLYLLQAVIKALTGAVLALIGVFALQRGLLGAYPPQPGDKVFLYALLFGLAQEPFTRVLDNRIKALLETVQSEGPARGRRSPAASPGSSP